MSDEFYVTSGNNAIALVLRRTLVLPILYSAIFDAGRSFNCGHIHNSPLSRDLDEAYLPLYRRSYLWQPRQACKTRRTPVARR